jgi:hypothetical protein
MKKKLLISVLSSLAIVVGAVSFAYALGTFKANQEGYRQGAAGQATHITMRVEAGMADANSELVPDIGTGWPGGALSFSITNTSQVPLRVSAIELASTSAYGTNGYAISSNKNTSGSFAPGGTGGTCSQWASFIAPTNFNNWPTIAPHTTLEVNGTDNNRLGAGMIHLSYYTDQGCQGATFAISLNVTADAVTNFGSNLVQP